MIKAFFEPENAADESSTSEDSLDKAQSKKSSLDRKRGNKQEQEAELNIFSQLVPPPSQSSPAPTPSPSIVPKGGEHGFALGAVIIIMSFLGCLALGGVGLITSATQDWQRQISREATIQIVPVEGQDIEQSLTKAHRLVTEFADVAQANILDKTDTQQLLEPWLGSQSEVIDLELPRLILVRFRDDIVPDIDFIRASVQQDIEGAFFDDHRMWIDQLSSTAQMLVFASLTVFIMTLATMMIVVFFATRATLLMNAHIIEVLHFIGADSRFVARQFDGYFLKIGLKSSGCGALLSILLFWLLQMNWGGSYILAESNQLALLFDSFTLKIRHLVAIIGLALLIAGLVTLTSRSTIIRQLHNIDRRQAVS